MSYSDEPALADLGFLNASIRYSCGPLLHFLVELYLAHGDNDANVTGIWREIVRRARLGQKEYDLSTFVSVSGDPDLLDRPAIAAILSTAGPERWNAVVDEMRRHGVGAEYRSNPALRARSVLMPFLKEQCSGLAPGQSYGFYSGEESYRLDSPEGCGLLSGGPEVVTLSGNSVARLTAQD